MNSDHENYENNSEEWEDEHYNEENDEGVENDKEWKLSQAIMEDDLESLRYMVEELKYEISDRMLDDFSWLASSRRHHYQDRYGGIISYLMEMGANPNIFLLLSADSVTGDEQIFLLALEHGANINARDSRGLTILDRLMERCKIYNMIKFVQNYIAELEETQDETILSFERRPKYDIHLNKEIKKYLKDDN